MSKYIIASFILKLTKKPRIRMFGIKIKRKCSRKFEGKYGFLINKIARSICTQNILADVGFKPELTRVILIPV